MFIFRVVFRVYSIPKSYVWITCKTFSVWQGVALHPTQARTGWIEVLPLHPVIGFLGIDRSPCSSFPIGFRPGPPQVEVREGLAHEATPGPGAPEGGSLRSWREPLHGAGRFTELRPSDGGAM